MTGNSLSNSEFKDFLFAPIGEERNGMVVTVLSALARLGIDPWQEAARLAHLPRERAAQSLASMIGGLPCGRWASPDCRVIATRLVQLLPLRNNSEASSVVGNRSVIQMIHYLVVMSLIYAVMWGALFMTGNRETSSGMNHADNPRISTVSPPQAPLLDSD